MEEAAALTAALRLGNMVLQKLCCTVYECGESGVKWDVQSMTRAELLSKLNTFDIKQRALHNGVWRCVDALVEVLCWVSLVHLSQFSLPIYDFGKKRVVDDNTLCAH